MENFLNFDKWTECGNGWDGHYRYVIGAKVAYEIIVLYHSTSTPILTAKANLYVVGLWRNSEGNITLERELIGGELPIQELLKMAQEDYNKNFKE